MELSEKTVKKNYVYNGRIINVRCDEAELPDGSYAMVFEMWDAMGNDAYSDAVTFDCENGEIWTTVYE